MARSLLIRAVGAALVAAAMTAGVASTAAPAATWRISTSARPVYDALGHAWKPDAYAIGGHREHHAISMRHTASPQLYQSRRAGVRGYAIPVAQSGTYAVVIYRADDGTAAAGTPLFDVSAQGHRVGTALARSTRAGLPDQVVFRVAVRGRRIDLRFTPRAGRGPVSISAVKVTRMSRSTQRPVVAWRDEFAGPAGTSPSGARWNYDLGVGASPGWGNDELETYTSRPENIGLDGNGHLAISARREALAGLDGVRRDFTSARINTHGRYAFEYGSVAARIKMPSGGGIWPSFWAVGDDVYRVGWPRSGEIDVVELLHSDPSTVWGSLHGPAPGGGPYAVSRELATSRPVSDGFHTYGAVWLPGAIQMRFDDRPYFTYTPEDLGRGRPWVFDHPFHLIMNVSVGGTHAGAVTEATPFPATMLVDWVRVAR